MTIQEKFDLLGGYVIKLIQWRDSKHRRLGLNRENEDDYLFICEYPTIEECLDRAILQHNGICGLISKEKQCLH